MTYTGAKTTVSIQSNIFGGEIKTFLIPFSISNRKIHTCFLKDVKTIEDWLQIASGTWYVPQISYFWIAGSLSVLLGILNVEHIVPCSAWEIIR